MDASDSQHGLRYGEIVMLEIILSRNDIRRRAQSKHQAHVSGNIVQTGKDWGRKDALR